MLEKEISNLDELKDLKAISTELDRQHGVFTDQQQQAMIELKNAKTKEEIDITEKKLDEIESKRTLCHSMDMDTLRKISKIEASHAGTKREAADIQQYFDQRIERIEKLEKEINAASKRQRNAAKEIAEINIEENIENQI